jgi:NDP-sugar pyrophosphorylase family protein
VRATAFILAAGLGTRLRPLTLSTPKPLLPVRGRPLLDHVLDHLHHHGHREIVANAHWLAAQVEAWGAARGVRVIVEPVILGTGGGLRNARGMLADRFVVVNGDILSDVDLTALSALPSPAAIAVRPQGEPRFPGVAMSGDVVTGISGVIGEGDPARHFTGIHAMDRSVLDHVPDGPQCIMRTAYRALVPQGRVRALVHRGVWTDIGTPEEYAAVR